mgnify:CR=1 FL=1
MAFEALSLMTKNQVVSFIKQVERGKKSLLQRYFEGWWEALIPALVSSSSSDVNVAQAAATRLLNSTS